MHNVFQRFAIALKLIDRSPIIRIADCNTDQELLFTGNGHVFSNDIGIADSRCHNTSAQTFGGGKQADGLDETTTIEN